MADKVTLIQSLTMKSSIKNFFGVLASAALILTLIFAIQTKVPKVEGSVTQGNEYNSTSTTVQFTKPRVLKTGVGVLGSVVITGTSTGALAIYDATTTDATKRTRSATTTLANFPNIAVAGTYTFDVVYVDGLLVDFTGGTGTTTITFR